MHSKPWLILSFLMFVTVPQAQADYDQRFSLGAGVAVTGNPSQTNFEIGAEYEYRLQAFLGLGLSGNYIFSTPGEGLIAAPDLFLHPFATEFLISAAPLLRIETGANDVGVRLGTRVPLPLGAISLVPSFAVDIIQGGPDLLFGLGFEF